MAGHTTGNRKDEFISMKQGSTKVYCLQENFKDLYEWFIPPNFSKWGQFGVMKVGCILPVIRILTFNISFFGVKNLGKIENQKFG